MVRNGWSVEDDLSKAFWKRILVGPRPPSTRWPPAQRAPAQKGRPQQKKERPSTSAEEGTHHSGEVDESVVCPRWFVARGASFTRKSREGKGRSHLSRINPCVTRRSSFGSSGEDCEARGGNYSSGTRRFNGEISVGGSFAEGQEGGEVDTKRREARFMFAICREGFKEASVVRSGSCKSGAGIIQARGPNWTKHGKIWRSCAPRHPRQQSHHFLPRMPAAKWSNSEQRLQS